MSEKFKGHSNAGGTNNAKPVKRLSYSDFKDRMSKGLCIHYDDKYTLGHKCRSKQVFMVTTEEEQIEGDNDTGEIEILWK